MKQLARTVCVLVFASATLLTYPSIYPTGTTIFDPDRTWSGYTIYGTPESKGAVLIDMNGNLLRRWPEIAAVPGPFRILPGGYLIGGTTQRKNHQEAVALVQMAWGGSIAWRFDRTELVEDEGQPPTWMARQHHDWHREGYPAGYYSPDANPLVDSGRTLVLVHRRISNPDVSDKLLEDDGLVEADWDGQIAWEWTASEHLEEFGFSEAALISIYRRPGWSESRQAGDWLHINSATYVGPNKWYDAGDERFHPDNVIMSSRNTNIIFIAERASGAIVWKMGPDYRDVPALRELGQIIGQHHPHIIPKGLPGAGNLLVFDNGGAAGYGAPNPSAHDGVNVTVRIHSRVLEIDPVTFEKVWEYSMPGQERFMFFSHYVSSAQRLPNGNTMITEGADGRMFEITAEGEIVWEYVSPFFDDRGQSNRVYRAFRVPYDWVPQLEAPTEQAVVPPDITEFRIEPQAF